jgi:hypothetical protein
MHKNTLWSLLLASPVALLGSSLIAGSAIAEEVKTSDLIAQSVSGTEVQDTQNVLDQLNRYSNEGKQDSQNQVNSVDQLRDVSPGDWAYDALKSLVENYNCIAGYPNGTFRGNRSLSRYEFAAGLNACLESIQRLIASNDATIRQDLDTIKQLVNSFKSELTALGARVDNLEGRVKFLEDHQFSTTTKLAGEVIFAATDSFETPDNTNTVFGDRFRLALNTSFTGKDKLITRLAGGNLNNISPDGSPTGVQTFNLGSNGNNVVVDWIAYYFPVEYGNVKFDTYVAATGGLHSDYAQTTAPYFDDFTGGSGSLSQFAAENPIYSIGGGAGLGLSFKLGLLDSIVGPSSITVGYLASNANNPTNGNGLFDGEYAALAQLNFGVSDSINIGLTYVNAYNTGNPTFNMGGGSAVVGTNLANLGGLTKSSNTYGAEVAWKISDGISFNGYFAFQDVSIKVAGNANDIDDEVWTYGGGLAFPDFGKEGNLLGIFAGVQPYLGSFMANNGSALPIHVEAFYKYKVSDNISITPGVIWIQSPEQIQDTDRVIGTIRTTFTF